MQSSLNNITDKYADFFKSLEECSYDVGGNITTFNFSEGNIITLGSLEEIIEVSQPPAYEYGVNGTMVQVAYADVILTINTPLSLLTVCDGILKDKKVLQQRITTFWNITQKHFMLPPTVCYKHDPFPDSYFDFGFMWNFCFILLNAKKQGIVICMGATD